MDGVRKGVTVGAEVGHVGGQLMIIGWASSTNTGYWLELLKAGKREVGGLQYVQWQIHSPYKFVVVIIALLFFLFLEIKKLQKPEPTCILSV